MINLTINNQQHQVDAAPDTPLLWVLRDLLGLTGTKFGCGIGACGACMVHLDGKATRSCKTSVADAAKSRITTIEGLAPSGGLHPVQEAWIAYDVPQCGYCQSGQLMSAAALLATNANPTDAEIATAMNGNICRCGTYQRVHAAVHLAAQIKRRG